MRVYLSDKWDGASTASEEMDPKWFTQDTIPFKEMWPDDEFWLPLVVSGSKVRGALTFGEGDMVEAQAVSVVDTL